MKYMEKLKRKQRAQLLSYRRQAKQDLEGLRFGLYTSIQDYLKNEDPENKAKLETYTALCLLAETRISTLTSMLEN